MFSPRQQAVSFIKNLFTVPYGKALKTPVFKKKRGNHYRTSFRSERDFLKMLISNTEA